MAYMIAKKSITEPKNAIDKKRHVHILYFCGVQDLGFCKMKRWEKRKNAVIYDTKKDAERVIRSLTTDKCYIVKL